MMPAGGLPPTQWGGSLDLDREEAGDIPSQVENVQWFLARCGRPEWSSRRLAQGLAERGFTHEGLRRVHGGDATLHDIPACDNHPWTYLRPFTTNLDFYESGILRVRLGIDGVEDFEISDCLPPDGWATPEDFARIRRHLEERGSITASRRRLPLVGLALKANGTPARLVAAPRGSHPLVNYRVAMLEGDSLAAQLHTTEPTIPHAAFADSIIEGLSKSGDAPLILVDQPDHDADLDLRSDVARQSAKVEHLRSSCSALRARLTEQDARGNLILHGPLLDDLQEEYNNLRASAVPDAERTLDQLQQQLEDRRQKREASHATARADQLLELVAALQSTDASDLSALWVSMIQDLELYGVSESVNTQKQITLSWSGKLVFGSGPDTFAVPFAGQRRFGSALQSDERVDLILESLVAGTPFGEIDVAYRKRLQPLVAERLGHTARSCVTLCCTDPRVLRVATRILLDSGLSDADVAKESGESESFVSRVREVHADTSRRRASWAVGRAHNLSRLLEVASRQGGRLSPGDHKGIADSWASVCAIAKSPQAHGQLTNRPRKGYEVQPCTHCGGLRRAPMAIPEPVGLLCLDCRQDQAGLVWPAEPYDRWVCAPEVWGLDSSK